MIPSYLLEPFHGILALQSVLESNNTCLATALSYTESRSSEDNVEVQAINANGGVVFDTKINVFLNTETEVASVGEVIFPQLVFSDFKTTFKDLFSLGTTDCAVDSNFFITADTKERTVYLAFEKTGCWPVSCSKTLVALVSLSPDSPTQMFRHNLRIRRSRIMFLDLSLLTTSVMMATIIPKEAPCCQIPH